MKKKLKNILCLYLLIFLFVSCNDKKKHFLVYNDSTRIDSIFRIVLKKDLSKEERKQLLDKAHRLLDAKPINTLSLKSYFTLADNYYYQDLLDEYLLVNKKILDYYKATGNVRAGIKSNYGIGVCNFIRFSNDSAFYYFSKAEKLSLKSKDKFYLEEIWGNKATLLFLVKDYAGAETMAVGALKIALRKGNPRIVYDSYITIGNSLEGMSNFSEASLYYEKAIIKSEELSEEPFHSTLVAQPYNYISKIFQKTRNCEKAIEYIDRGLQIDNFKTSDPIIYCYLKNTKAYSQFMLGHEDCEKAFFETLRIGDSINNANILITSSLHLSEYYLAIKKDEKAKHYAKEARVMAHQNNVFEDELKALELLAKIDPKNDSAYDKRYITLNDSLQNVERATRNKFARIEFETDEITSQKNLAEAENGKLIAQRWMILGFSLFSITLIILFYISRLQGAKNRELHYLQKQQLANAEIYQLMLDQQQKIEEGKQIEQRRISKELHDGIMGKLTAIRLNLFVLGKKTDPETVAKCLEHVDEIQEVEKEVRKISHDLSQNLFADVSDFTLMVTNLVEAAKGHSQLQFKLITDENIDWNTINSVVKMQVYRILQEALHNIRKYAKAKSVCIRMSSEERLLTISITDDGIGFDPKAIKPGIGHKNMRERASEINGELTIWSEIGKGTQINLKILT